MKVKLLLLLLLSFVITKKTEGKFICIHVLYVAQKNVDAVIYYIDIAMVSNTKEKFNKKENRERKNFKGFSMLLLICLRIPIVENTS